MLRPVIFLSFIHIIISNKVPPSICVSGGTCYRGAWINGTDIVTTFVSFQGIRYAQPPIGKLRLNESAREASTLQAC